MGSLKQPAYAAHGSGPQCLVTRCASTALLTVLLLPFHLLYPRQSLVTIPVTICLQELTSHILRSC